MRQKELRLALVCYGGISLAVYMHGITKEIWRLARASRNFHAGDPAPGGSQAVYRQILQDMAAREEVMLRVLPDIIAGASAGGINGIFLAQALATGQSLDPLTDLWLECADIDVLLDPDARPVHWFSKFWAQPLVWLVLSRPGGAVERTVAKEARSEVRTKLSRFIRARWFAPPFSGSGFSRLLYDAHQAMADGPAGPRLIPRGQPLDLFVTVTDFHGHLEKLRLNSPAEVVESEHRLTIGFSFMSGKDDSLADPAELTFAARATASFPGAFPPFNVGEIDRMLDQRKIAWPGRAAFLGRIFPRQAQSGKAEDAVLIDGSVLANAPFSQAIDALKNRPAHREVDRRFVYIDPKPDFTRIEDRENEAQSRKKLPGFFSTIFGAISDIPREQPIRDNLESIETRTNRIRRMRHITDSLRAEVDADIAKLFGRTLFFDNPTPKRLAGWRNKAQDKAAQMAGFTYAAYGQLKLSGIIEDIIRTFRRAHKGGDMLYHQQLREALWSELRRRGLERLSDSKGGATAEAITFFKSQDLGFRIRRLKFLARRLGQDIIDTGTAPAEAVVAMQETIYSCLSHYLDCETVSNLGSGFETIAAEAPYQPGQALDALAERRDLRGIDALVDEQLARSLALLPREERRSMLLTYLGFPFYDIATLPLLQGEGQNEFDPIKVDRISPDDAPSIRSGGAEATLKGIEFNSFGAFFSRAYRENDYLWGRLHGAERMVDLLISTARNPDHFTAQQIARYKRDAFMAILDEEAERLTVDPDLVPGIRAEIEEKFGPALAI
ncbi:MAG: patatin-like protein [Blastomonas sp.]